MSVPELCKGKHMIYNLSFCRIFGHHGNTADDIIYVNWLNMVRAGLLALEFYTPETYAWKQVSLLTAVKADVTMMM